MEKYCREADSAALNTGAGSSSGNLGGGFAEAKEQERN
jgi:hypothetical protein